MTPSPADVGEFVRLQKLADEPVGMTDPRLRTQYTACDDIRRIQLAEKLAPQLIRLVVKAAEHYESFYDGSCPIHGSSDESCPPDECWVSVMIAIAEGCR